MSSPQKYYLCFFLPRHFDLNRSSLFNKLIIIFCDPTLLKVGRVHVYPHLVLLSITKNQMTYKEERNHKNREKAN